MLKWKLAFLVVLTLLISIPLAFAVIQVPPNFTAYTDNAGSVTLSQTAYFNAVYVSTNLIQFDLTGTLSLNSGSVNMTLTPTNSQYMEVSIIDQSEQISVTQGQVSSSQWFSGNKTLVIYSLTSTQWVYVSGSPATVTQTLVTGVDVGAGSVSPNCPSPSGCPEAVGSSVTVSATATSGWTFSSWTVTGASCPEGYSSNPCTFSMPSNSVTVSATFTQITVSSTTTSVSSSTMTTLSSTTNSTVSSTTSSVSSSTSVVAAQMFAAVGSGQGSVTPSCPNGCSETVGSQVTVAASPGSGWLFSGWSTQSGQSCSSNPCTFNMPNNQVTLKATFTQTMPTLTTNVASGSGSVTPNCPGPNGCSTAVNSPVSVTANPSAGWQFSSWSVPGASCSGGSSTNPCAFTMPNNPVTVSATFTQTPPNAQSLFSGVDSGQGTISPNCPNGCSESVGSSITVQANPSSVWQFSGWSTQIGISCSANPCTFSMPNNAVTLKATFAQLAQTSTQSSMDPAQTVTVTQSPPPTTITNSVTVTQWVTQMQTVTQTMLVSNSVGAGTGSSSKVSTATLRSSTSTVAKRERNGFYFLEFQDLSQWWTAILLMLSGAWLVLRFPRYRTGGLAIISKLTKLSGGATSKP